MNKQKSGFASVSGEFLTTVCVIAILLAMILPYYFKGKVAKSARVSQPQLPVTIVEQKARLVEVGNGSFVELIISTRYDISAASRVLQEVSKFEAAHPGLRITGRQVMFGGSGSIYGIFLWHERVTNANAMLERLTPKR